MLTLQQLRVLLAIKQTGSLNRAAHELHYGVPTVAHHLDALEFQLRSTLVVRGRRGTHLTGLGSALADDAAEILARVAQAERRIVEHRDAGLLLLRVGTFPSLGSRILPGAIRALQAEMTVQVEVTEGEPTRLMELLRAGEIHSALIYDIADSASAALDLDFLPLFSEPYLVMVGAQSELAASGHVDLEEVRGRSWIFSRSEQEATDRVLRRACGSLGYEPGEFMRTDDLNLIHGFVAADLALALTSASAMTGMPGVVTRPAVQHLGMRHFSYVSRRSAPFAAQRLGETIVAGLIETGSTMPTTEPSRVSPDAAQPEG
jgi:DNA-binding transcriptional LysR family regulator